MIDDPEMNALFRAENEDRLHHLEEGLKKLEQESSSIPDIEEIFRDVHTVKGAARMLGISSIEMVAHAMENGLDSARHARLVLSPPILALFHEIVEILRLLTLEATEGFPSGIDAEAVAKKLALPALEALQSENPPTAVQDVGREQAPSEEKKPEERPLASKPTLTPSPVSAPREAPEPGQKKASSLTKSREGKTEPEGVKRQGGASVLRIHSRQLNELVTQARDLNVAKNRVVRLMEDIGDMWLLWEFNNLMRLLQKKLLYRGEGPADAARQEENAENELLIKKFEQIGQKWGLLRDTAYESIHKLDNVAIRLLDQINGLGLVPLKRLFNVFPPMVQELAASCGKEVDFIVEGEDNPVDKRIIDDMKDPLMHLVRNSIDHGIESAAIRAARQKPRKGVVKLKARQTSNTLIIELQDDGGGLDLSAIKASAIDNHLYSTEELAAMNETEIQFLIFSPGISVKRTVSNISGRGLGLNIVRDYIEKLHGNIHVESIEGQGCTFVIQLPTIFVTTHVLMIKVEGRTYAVPIEAVEVNVLFSLEEVFTVEGQDTLYIQNQPLSVVSLAEILSGEKRGTDDGSGRTRFLCVVLKVSGKRLALLVDEVFEEQKIVVTPFYECLGNIPNFIGAAIMKTGEVCLVLNARDIVEKIQKQGLGPSKLSNLSKGAKKQKIILVADDSNLVRVMLKRVLESENYRVVVAEHGGAALKIIEETPIDALISDIQMPVMDGYDLVSRIRMMAEGYKLPIILISTLSSLEDKRKGLAVGANAFINKSQLNSTLILDTLRQLLG